MSELLKKVLDDVKTAMKAREKEKLVSLRSFHSEIKNVGINNGVDITDQIVIEVAQKFIKQRRDAAEQFEKGGREDLVAQEKAQIEWISPYLPKQMSLEEVTSLAKSAVEESGATSKKDMGKVMKILMPKVKGKADGKMVSSAVNQLLG